MGPVPLQDTWKFHSFRSERKLEQSRGQLKEKNINHNNVVYQSLYVVRRCLFLVYVKLTRVVSCGYSKPMCAEMKVFRLLVWGKKKKVIECFGKRKFEQTETYDLPIMRLALAEFA
jgi:hypothetical protein